jgi:peptide/nickel transport system substrate-binding protein
VWFVYFADQWNPKSPWHDQRVRLAANYAVDKQAINEAETLGLSKITGTTIPSQFDFALPMEAYPYDPAKARQLLKEAGYPNGFDAGDITPNPPFFSYAEGVANFLSMVGIKVKMRTVERATFCTSWREKKLTNLILGASGAPGNAATRLEAFAVTGGAPPDAPTRCSGSCAISPGACGPRRPSGTPRRRWTSARKRRTQ